MNVPVISIVVPIYRVMPYLSACIESVLAQSYTDFELLLIDDGSPDNCGVICEEYAKKDFRIKVFHKPNGGLSSARNYGMNKAVGKWIIFLDSDDLWGDVDGLLKLLEYAEELNLDILRFEYQAIDENGKKIYPRQSKDKAISKRSFSNFEMVDKAIAGEWFAWLYLIRRSVVNTLRFDEACPFQEDIDFYCKLFAGKELICGYLPEKIYYYRKRDCSLTTSYNINNLIGSFRLCEVFHEQSTLTNDDRLSSLYRFYSVMMYYWTLCTLSEEPYYNQKKEIVKYLHIKDLHIRTCRRMEYASIPVKNKVFIILKPMWGVRLLHIKNTLVFRYHKLISRL